MHRPLPPPLPAPGHRSLFGRCRAPSARTFSFGLAAFVCACVIPVQGQTPAPRLLADIERTNDPVAGSDPDDFATDGRRVYFAATLRDVGSEPWVAADGAVLPLGDLAPGSAGSSPGSWTRSPAPGESMLFVCDDGTHGRELWTTDGTSAGTRLLVDLAPGVRSSRPDRLTSIGGLVYFVADDGNSGRELHVTDGTAAGTRQVADIHPGAGDADPDGLCPFGGRVWFCADDGVHGPELWSTDGTQAGTSMLLDLEPVFGSSPAQLTVLGNRLFFVAGVFNPTPLNRELWSTDGTAAGTRIVVDLRPGPDSPDIGELTVLGNELIFRASVSPWATELFRSDGTSIRLLRDIHTTPGFSGAPRLLTKLGNKILFSAFDTTLGVEPYVTDGTTAGTVPLADLLSPRGGSNPQEIVTSGTSAFLVARGANGNELYVTDGTTAGTRLVRDIAPGVASADPRGLVGLGNGIVVFSADDGTNGREPWVSDGTAAGTVRIADLAGPDPTATLGSDPAAFAEHLGLTWFVATDATHGREPWVSDGTTAGTRRLLDIRPGRGDSIPVSPFADGPVFQEFGGRVFFAADDGTHGTEVWVSDGTAAGTRLFADAFPGRGSSNPGTMAWAGGRLLFGGQTGTVGNELIASDGTPGGTVVLRDIQPGSPASGSPSQFVTLGDRAYFTAIDSASGWELWTSDGTTAGTLRVSDINPGGGSASIRHLTVHDGLLWFSANDPNVGEELFVSDGTSAGTRLHTDIGPRGLSSRPGPFVAVGDVLYFAATDAIGGNGPGRELFRATASTPARLVADVHPGVDGSDPEGLVATADGTVWFSADGGASLGRELWRTDGTAAGTTLVADLAFERGSDPTGLVAVGDRVWFSADATASQGRELWTSDGTPAGTVLVADLSPGAAGSAPAEACVVRGALVFSADDGLRGREPWIVRDPGASTQDLGQACGASGPRLVAGTLPTLGTTLELASAGVPAAGSLRATVLGRPLATPTALGGCPFHLEASTLALAETAATNGPWRLRLSVPRDPALDGVRLVAQTLYLTPPASTVQATNGLLLTLGR